MNNNNNNNKKETTFPSSVSNNTLHKSNSTKQLENEKKKLLKKLRKTHNEIATKQMTKRLKRKAALNISSKLYHIILKYLHRIQSKAFLTWKLNIQDKNHINHWSKTMLRIFANRRKVNMLKKLGLSI